MQYDDPVNLDPHYASSTRAQWRLRAVQLAVERGLAGQAQLVKADPHGVDTYRCVSASEPSDHYVTSLVNSVVCDCPAGHHGQPCSHAGAVLLLIAGLAPERSRDPEGFTHG